MAPLMLCLYKRVGMLLLCSTWVPSRDGTKMLLVYPEYHSGYFYEYELHVCNTLILFYNQRFLSNTYVIKSWTLAYMYIWVYSHYSIVIFQFFFSWSITWSYFTFHGYLWTDFLEYPLLLIQQITVICLYFHINKTLSKIGTFAFLVVYFLTVYSWLQSPEWFLQILIVR